MKKIFFNFLILIFLIDTGISSSSYGYGKNLDEEKIIQLLTEEKILEVVQLYGTSAVPYLLKILKSKNNVKIRKASIITVGYIIKRKSIGPSALEGKINFRDSKYFTEEEKLWFEKIFQVFLNLSNDPSEEIRKEVASHLRLFGDKRAIPVLKKLLKDPKRRVRYEAWISLRKLGQKQYSYLEVMAGKKPQTLEDYLQFLNDTSSFHLHSLAGYEIIEKFGNEAIPALLKIATSNKEPARRRAINLLGILKAEKAIPVFENYLKEETRNETVLNLQYSCIYALARINTLESMKVLKENGLNHSDYRIKLMTAKLLFSKEKEKVKKILKELAKSKNPEIRYKIAKIMIENKEKEGIPILIGLLRNRSYFGITKNYLENITKQKFGRIPPVVSKKMLEEYIEKWESWWEENKDTFKFPEDDSNCKN